MAKKSKTQKAKASARRAEKKAAAQELETLDTQDANAEDAGAAATAKSAKAGKTDAKGSKATKSTKENSSSQKQFSKKEAPAPKKKTGIVKFFNDVKAELKRVTWPTKQDVAQWSGVVVVALLFFGIYVAILDSGIITPLLVAYSGLGA